jgi:hypothetical protein
MFIFKLHEDNDSMPTLLEKIGNRSVMVDENLPLALADVLREKGLSVRHVNEMNKPMSDNHILIQMHDTDVLITKDRHFRFVVGKSRSIFIEPGTTIEQLLAMVG